MTFLEKFEKNWKNLFGQQITTGQKVIVAISGGVDSIVMTQLLIQQGLDITLAHCNFQLREASNDDEQFVRAFAQDLHLPIEVATFDTQFVATQRKLGIEETARILRYDWFAQLSRTIGHDRTIPIFVGHHANDNIETVLFHFFRGTGITGMHGILPIHNGIYRPMLFATKQEIVQYAIGKKMHWVEDLSNRDTRYTRNFIRHDILPELKSYIPNIEQNILSNIERLTAVEHIYKTQIEQYKNTLIHIKSNGNKHINIAALVDIQEYKTVLWEIIQPLGFNARQILEVEKLLFNAASGSYISNEQYSISKNRSELIIAEQKNEQQEQILIDHNTTTTSFAEYDIKIELARKEESKLDFAPNICYLDADRLEWPIIVRHWKKGDRFTPLGMKGNKKVSDYFIDAKIPTVEKENTLIFQSGANIIWIAGHRQDDRYKIDKNTSHICIISIHKMEKKDSLDLG